MAVALRSELHILHVVPVASSWAGSKGSSKNTKVEDTEDDSARWLQELAFACGAAPVRTVVRHGAIPETILEYAAEAHANLIVVGMRGSGRAPQLFGSVARAIQSGATCPVVAVAERHDRQDVAANAWTAPGSPARRGILVPTDFSEHSRLALALACELARSSGRSVHALHVLEATRQLAYVPPVEAREEILVARARRRLELEIEPYLDDNVAVRAEVKIGEPAATILSAVHEVDPGLLVMGTHGRSAWQQFVLGSVTQRVLRQAAPRVLTVCAPRRDVRLGSRGREGSARATHSGQEPSCCESYRE